jgi:uncharacterized protein YkwD
MKTIGCLLSLAGALASAAAAPPAPCDRLQAGDVLAQVNALRAQGGVCGGRGAQAPSAPLVWSPQLQTLAEQQAGWMAESGAMAHQGPGGEGLAQRARDANYAHARIGENLAHGQRSVDQVLAGWSASEAHCMNLHDGRVTEMALACVPGRDGRPFWTLLTGRPR